VCTPKETGDARVIRAAGIAFVELIRSSNVLGVVLYERLGNLVCEIAFVFRTIDQRDWQKLSIHQSIEYGDAGGVATKRGVCLCPSARHNGQKRENQGGFAHDDGGFLFYAAKIHFFNLHVSLVSARIMRMRYFSIFADSIAYCLLPFPYSLLP
jgi:hypothetical protein